MMSYGPGPCPNMQALINQGVNCETCRYLALCGYSYKCDNHRYKPESKPMKKYRCKIKGPYGDVGDILNNMSYSFNFDSYPDLFEEITDCWVPEYGERYFAIIASDKDGEFMVEERFWDGYTFDIIRLKQNRVFRTKEKAEEVLNKMLQVLKENKEV